MTLELITTNVLRYTLSASQAIIRFNLEKRTTSEKTISGLHFFSF